MVSTLGYLAFLGVSCCHTHLVTQIPPFRLSSRCTPAKGFLNVLTHWYLTPDWFRGIWQNSGSLPMRHAMEAVSMPNATVCGDAHSNWLVWVLKQVLGPRIMHLIDLGFWLYLLGCNAIALKTGYGTTTWKRVVQVF